MRILENIKYPYEMYKAYKVIKAYKYVNDNYDNWEELNIPVSDRGYCNGLHYSTATNRTVDYLKHKYPILFKNLEAWDVIDYRLYINEYRYFIKKCNDSELNYLFR